VSPELLGEGVLVVVVVEICDFSISSCFSTKLDVSGWFSSAVTIEVGSGDSLCSCDSKTVRTSNGALFSSPVRYGVGDVLAVVDRFRGCKMTSLGVCGLA